MRRLPTIGADVTSTEQGLSRTRMQLFDHPGKQSSQVRNPNAIFVDARASQSH